MNRKALRELLGEAGTDEVIDSIMAANGADINSAKQGSEALSAKVAELTAQNKQLTDAAASSRSSEDSLQAQVEEARKQTAKVMRELSEQSALAVFAKAGLTEEECRPLLSAVVSDDRKATVSAAESIAAIVAAKVKEATEKAGKESLGSMGAPEGGDPSDGTVTTVADFLKLPYAKQLELKTQNPGILKELK